MSRTFHRPCTPLVAYSQQFLCVYQNCNSLKSLRRELAREGAKVWERFEYQPRIFKGGCFSLGNIQGRFFLTIPFLFLAQTLIILISHNRIVCNTLCCVDATRCVCATWLGCGVDATVTVAWMQQRERGKPKQGESVSNVSKQSFFLGQFFIRERFTNQARNSLFYLHPTKHLIFQAFLRKQHLSLCY